MPLVELLDLDPETFYTSVDQYEVKIRDLRSIHLTDLNSIQDQWMSMDTLCFLLTTRFYHLKASNEIRSNPVVLGHLSSDIQHYFRGNEDESMCSFINLYYKEYKDLVKHHDVLVIPLNIGSHWTIIVVEFKPWRRFYAFNSSVEVPYVVDKARVWKKVHSFISCMFINFFEEFAYIEVEGLPFQPDVTSCGLYCIWFVERHLTKKELNLGKFTHEAIVVDYRELLSHHMLDLFDMRSRKRVEVDPRNGLPGQKISLLNKEYAVKRRQLSIALAEREACMKAQTDDIDSDEGLVPYHPNILAIMNVVEKNRAVVVQTNANSITSEVNKISASIQQKVSLDENVNCNYPSYEESKELVNSVSIPFVGLNEEGKVVTYNVTKTDWKEYKTMREVIEHISGRDYMKMDYSVKKVLVEEMQINSDLFMNWILSSIEAKDSMFGFVWHSTRYFLFIESELKKIRDDVPMNKKRMVYVQKLRLRKKLRSKEKRKVLLKK